MAFDPLTAALDIGGKLIDKIWPDPAQRDQAKLELLRLHQTGELAQLTADTEIAKGQIAVNAEEAKSSSFFVSGGRPFIIWIGGITLLDQYVIGPKIEQIATLMGHVYTYHPLDVQYIMTLIASLLGLGGYRTYEKLKGVAS